MATKLNPDEKELVTEVIRGTAEKLTDLLNRTDDGDTIVESVLALSVESNTALPPEIASRITIVIGLIDDEQKLMVGFRYNEHLN